MKYLFVLILFLQLLHPIPTYSQLNSLNLRLGNSIDYLGQNVGLGINIGVSSTLCYAKNDKSPKFEAEMLFTQFAFPANNKEVIYKITAINQNFGKIIELNDKHELLIGAQISQILRSEFENSAGEKQRYNYQSILFSPMFAYRFFINEKFKIDIRSLLALYDSDFNNNHLTVQFSVQYKLK